MWWGVGAVVVPWPGVQAGRLQAEAGVLCVCLAFWGKVVYLCVVARCTHEESRPH